MMQKLRFTWDQQGHATVLAEPPHDVLADFLAEEIQSDLSLCKRMLDIIRALRLGRHSTWDNEGESWSVRLSKTRAAITSEFAVPGRTLEITLEEFEEAVGSWQRFLEISRA